MPEVVKDSELVGFGVVFEGGLASVGFYPGGGDAAFLSFFGWLGFIMFVVPLCYL